MAAGIALPADHLGLNGDLLAHRQPRHPLAQRGNLAGDLMPLGHRIGCKRVLSMVHMDVGATDPDALDLDQDLSRARLGYRHLPEFDDPGRCHNLLQHTVFLLTFRSTSGGRRH